MAPKENIFQKLQHLDQSNSAERQAARQKRQQQSSGEILQTFLAYKLDHAAEKMGLGLAIGDPLTLLHEPSNQWDSNAIKVSWQEQWIGYLPKDMAELIAAEVPEVATGLEAVITGLTTTSLRDAFRLQISIPIAKASRKLKELGVTSAFAWDFDRTSGSDKLRLVINCTETAFRELQNLLQASYDVSKCGYSYYPTQDGRHYPWYLSLTDNRGKAPSDTEDVERLIRSFFGIASETTRSDERQEQLVELEQKQKEINNRLEISRAEEKRLRREFDLNKRSLILRAEKAKEQGEEAIEFAQSVEIDLQQEVNLKEQELQLALAENRLLIDQVEKNKNENETLNLQLQFLEQVSPSMVQGDLSLSTWANTALKSDAIPLDEKLFLALQKLIAQVRITPKQCLELVSKELCSNELLVLDAAWSSADQIKNFEHNDELFQLLWILATKYRDQKIAGAPDRIAGKVFGGSNYAARESESIKRNPQAKRERTFTYQSKTIEMWQHLKIGVKDSTVRTLRIHFCWDEELKVVVIGHCGKHLFNPNH